MTTGVEPRADGHDAHDAALVVLTDSAPPGSHDHEREHRAPTPEERLLQGAPALAVLRRGLAVTPELRQGLVLTVAFAVVTALGKLAVPVLIQQVLDRGILGERGYRPAFVAVSCLAIGGLIVMVYVAGRATFLRLVRAAEASLLGLRTRTFSHVHELSIAEHVDHRRGALVARVTSDVETLAQFTEWGAMAWIVDSILIVTTLAVMAAYSWPLTLVTVAVFLPLLPVMRALQRRQLAAYDEVRAAVRQEMALVLERVAHTDGVVTGLIDAVRSVQEQLAQAAIRREELCDLTAERIQATTTVARPVTVSGRVSITGTTTLRGTVGEPTR